MSQLCFGECLLSLSNQTLEYWSFVTFSGF